jgi:hypothetical protein
VVRWPGRWGRTRAGAFPGESSPRGPAFQDEGPWRDPDGYLSGALVAAVAAAVAAAALTSRALRRRLLTST